MRVFKVKKPKTSFFCALCRAPRQLTYQRHLGTHHYVQIVATTVFLTWALFPYLQFKTLGLVFPLWGAFEFTRKLLYRKELPCPYCGFDATWYRKDVRIARRQVEEFFRENPAAAQFRPTNHQ